jgi:hypothetical protein
MTTWRGWFCVWQQLHVADALLLLEASVCNRLSAIDPEQLDRHKHTPDSNHGGCYHRSIWTLALNKHKLPGATPRLQELLPLLPLPPLLPPIFGAHLLVSVHAKLNGGDLTGRHLLLFGGRHGCCCCL